MTEIASCAPRHRVDVRRDLLHEEDEAALEGAKRRQLAAQGREHVVQYLVTLAVESGVAVQVIDEGTVELVLLLERGRDEFPDEPLHVGPQP